MKRETLKAFTERAVAATINGTLIPPVVYIPAGLRRKTVRTREVLTINPADEAENELRTAQADPVGFLIAVMQGQPIPSFDVREESKRIVVETKYETPDLALRVTAGRALVELKRRTKNATLGISEYDAMIRDQASKA